MVCDMTVGVCEGVTCERSSDVGEEVSCVRRGSGV